MNTNPEKNNISKDENVDEILEILESYKKFEPESDKKTEEQAEVPDEGATKITDAVTAHFTEVIDAAAIRRAGGDMTMHFAALEEEKSEPENDDKTETVIEKMPKRRRKNKVAKGAFGLFSGIFKTLMYIIFVLGVSAYVSYNVIMIGNDIFAFVKPENVKTITLTENMTNKDVAKLLEDNGIISFDWVFELYVKNKYTKNPYLTGEIEVSPNMNYDELLIKLKFVETVREVVKITIPEGYTTDQIIELLTSNGIGNKKDYIDVINNYPFKHKFIAKLADIPKSPDRRYRLEGYMFPDTYLFYRDDSAVTVINKMLNNFESKFDESFYARCDVLGMNFDEIIILASMVEAEAKFPIDLECVSSVFHNRLNSELSYFKKMQCDATVQYFLPERKEILPISDTEIDHPYNTYIYEGLPPGAISNPGIDAITAALWPDNPVNDNGVSFKAYYFVSNLSGKTYYAATKEAHDQNIKKAKADNAEYNSLYNNESRS